MSGAQSKCLFVPLARFQRSQGEDKTSLCSQCEIRLNQLVESAGGGGGGGERATLAWMRHWFIQAQIKVPSSAGTKFLKYLPLVGSQNIRINHYTQRVSVV